jgi:hypothetical protein
MNLSALKTKRDPENPFFQPVDTFPEAEGKPGLNINALAGGNKTTTPQIAPEAPSLKEGITKGFTETRQRLSQTPVIRGLNMVFAPTIEDLDEEQRQKLEETGIAFSKFGEIVTKKPGGGVQGLDVIGVGMSDDITGGAKRWLSKILKEGDEETVKVAKQLADNLKGEVDTSKLQKTGETLKKLSKKKIKPVDIDPRLLQPKTAKVPDTKALTGQTDDLTSQIRKAKQEGKSFEEFVDDFVYHGTRKQFDEVDFSRVGKGSTGNVAGTGFYATNDFNAAMEYAKVANSEIPVPGYQTIDELNKLENGVVLMTKKPKGNFIKFDEFLSSKPNKDFYLEGLKRMEKNGFDDILSHEGVLNKLEPERMRGETLERVLNNINMEIVNDMRYKNLVGEDFSIYDFFIDKNKYDGIIMSAAKFPGSEKILSKDAKDIILFDKGNKIKMYPGKTKSQLKQMWDETDKIEQPERNLPMVIQGETFTLKDTKAPTKPTRTQLKNEIKATQKEIKNARVAQEKAAKLEAKEMKIRQETLDNLPKHLKGKTDNIIDKLKKKNLSEEDINNILLEDGTKLVDTVRVKRNPDGSLATYITKDQINEIEKFYTGKTPDKWIKKYSVERIGEKAGDLAKIYELPQLYFERKGIYQIYSKIVHEGDRAAEAQKNSFLARFKEAGLFKEGGWFTADRFNLSGKESDRIGKYYLNRQGKGYEVTYDQLSQKEKQFVDIFDGIISETEPRFYEVAKKNGKDPGKVDNYAPIMTRDDIELADQAGTMDFIMRKHPAFFSLKKRQPKVPKEMYETDYRKVASRWLSGITKFNNLGDVSQDVKYLLNSEEFKNIVNEKDWSIINQWLRHTITNPQPDTAREQVVSSLARFLRQTAAYSSLGLNYASVVKQTLTQVPFTIIEKAPPKARSKFAKAFNISVEDLPSLTSRKGNIAIQDMQGRIGRIFTGPLTQFDKKNAQASMNALLDKEYKKYLKQGEEISQETIDIITQKAQDKLDLWYGGMVSTGQRPEAFRTELGKFINMFIYPLTSQLNGFFRHIMTAKGVAKPKAAAEVMAAATVIAYMEQAISNLSPQWSDEKEMTKDTLISLTGNIPIVGQIAWAVFMDQELQISAGVSGIETVRRKISEMSKGMAEPGELGFAIGEAFGLPKQFRRTFYEGMRIINEGGIRDKNGKMLAPVQETDELMRSIMRGKYGSLAAKDWIRNIGEKRENRRWFVPEVEFLQNGDYERKAELYRRFTKEKQEELRQYLSEGQQSELDKALEEKKESGLDAIFQADTKKSLDAIFK